MSSSPAIMRSNVDFPQPDGPTKTTNSPSLMWISTPLMISTRPKDFLTPLSETSAMSDGSRFPIHVRQFGVSDRLVGLEEWG
jgi:hypothetical protein